MDWTNVEEMPHPHYKPVVGIGTLNDIVKYCINDLKLNVMGLMCIPPLEMDPSKYFIKLADLAKENDLNQLDRPSILQD